MANGNGAPTNGTGDGGPRHDETSFSIVNTISVIVILAYVSFLPLWMFFPPKGTESVLAIINQMMGAWGYAFAAVIGYHLGSSRSSKDAQAANRETMTTLATTVATGANTAASIAAAVPIAPVAPPPGPSAPAAPLAGAAGPSPTDGALAAATEGGTDTVHVEGDVKVTGAPEGATDKTRQG